jgi:DNA-binding NtrC family response regulator
MIEVGPLAGVAAAAGGAGGGAGDAMDAIHPAIPKIVCDGNLTLDEVERETIIATLVHHNGHRQRSAKALGIGVRTLGLKLRKWKDQKLVSPTL